MVNEEPRAAFAAQLVVFCCTFKAVSAAGDWHPGGGGSAACVPPPPGSGPWAPLSSAASCFLLTRCEFWFLCAAAGWLHNWVRVGKWISQQEQDAAAKREAARVAVCSLMAAQKGQQKVTKGGGRLTGTGVALVSGDGTAPDSGTENGSSSRRQAAGGSAGHSPLHSSSRTAVAAPAAVESRARLFAKQHAAAAAAPRQPSGAHEAAAVGQATPTAPDAEARAQAEMVGVPAHRPSLPGTQLQRLASAGAFSVTSSTELGLFGGDEALMGEYKQLFPAPAQAPVVLPSAVSSQQMLRPPEVVSAGDGPSTRMQYGGEPVGFQLNDEDDIDGQGPSVQEPVAPAASASHLPGAASSGARPPSRPVRRSFSENVPIRGFSITSSRSPYCHDQSVGIGTDGSSSGTGGVASITSPTGSSAVATAAAAPSPAAFLPSTSFAGGGGCRVSGAIPMVNPASNRGTAALRRRRAGTMGQLTFNTGTASAGLASGVSFDAVNPRASFCGQASADGTSASVVSSGGLGVHPARYGLAPTVFTTAAAAMGSPQQSSPPLPSPSGSGAPRIAALAATAPKVDTSGAEHGGGGSGRSMEPSTHASTALVPGVSAPLSCITLRQWRSERSLLHNARESPASSHLNSGQQQQLDTGGADATASTRASCDIAGARLAARMLRTPQSLGSTRTGTRSVASISDPPSRRPTIAGMAASGEPELPFPASSPAEMMLANLELGVTVIVCFGQLLASIQQCPMQDATAATVAEAGAGWRCRLPLLLLAAQLLISAGNAAWHAFAQHRLLEPKCQGGTEVEASRPALRVLQILSGGGRTSRRIWALFVRVPLAGSLTQLALLSAGVRCAPTALHGLQLAASAFAAHGAASHECASALLLSVSGERLMRASPCNLQIYSVP